MIVFAAVKDIRIHICSSMTKYDLASPKLIAYFVAVCLSCQCVGHPALIGRHRPFPVTHQAAERWLQHMQNALDDSLDIDQDSKIKMMKFFR